MATIPDFLSADDTIQVDASGFGGGLEPGAIAINQFFLGSSANDPQDRFIYNENSGALYFDRDGTGSAAQIQFASLSNSFLINSSDIVVI